MRSDLFALRHLAHLLLVCVVAGTVSLSFASAAAADVRFSTKGSVEIGNQALPVKDRLLDMLGTDARVTPARRTTLSRALGLVRDLPRPQIEYSEAFVDSLPMPKGGAQQQCLTEALYFEARGESVEGVFAVAEVILNRADSHRFPDSVCAVITQGVGKGRGCQFSYKCDRHPEVFRERQAKERMAKIAALMLEGDAPADLTDGALFYHTKAVNPSWAQVFDRTTTIGAHHFYNYG